ncbi:MAG: MBL fold metallo-hydrolase [Cuniculiplasma sp.]
MASEMLSFDIISDGTFSLDPGAIFGMTPRNVWSREFKVNENYRILLNANISIIEDDGTFYMIDSGIGPSPGEYLEKWFEAKPNNNLKNYMEKRKISKIHSIFHTHLHFDHMGHSFKDLSSSISYADHREVENFKFPNELALSSYTYGDKSLDISGLRPIFWDQDIGPFTIMHTGGHTTGHQAILFKKGNIKLMFPGDLIPSTFHLKPTRITAIDSEPLKSLKNKKELIKKAINENYTVILVHDMKTMAVRLSGNTDAPKYEEVA